MQFVLEILFQFITEYLFDKYKKISWRLFLVSILIGFVVLSRSFPETVWWKLCLLATGIGMLATVLLLLLWHTLWKLLR